MHDLNARPARAARRFRRGSTWLLLVAALLLIGGCSLPQFGAPEEEVEAPFEAEPYEPDLPTPLAAADDAAGEAETSTDATADTDDAADGENADGADSTDSTDESANLLSDPDPVNPATGRRQYNGEVVAKDRTTVMAEVNGMAMEVAYEVGDRVEPGDVLARVDSATLEAQAAQALAGLEAAQAQLDLLLIDPDETDLEAARAAVTAAAAAYQRALEGATSEDERLALAQLRQAEAAVTNAQAAYNEVKGNPRIGMLPQSLQLEQATLQVEAAQAQYDKVLKGSTSDVITGAYAQLAQARAQLARLEDGAEDAQIRAAEAQVKQAETALYLAQLQLNKTAVKAPVAGTLSEVNTTVGSMIAPGAPVATIMSPVTEVIIQVEETRLTELAEGLPAVLLVDAYPDRLFDGVVTRIAPELDPATRTVAVTILPDDEEGLLAPGMYTTVELLAAGR